MIAALPAAKMSAVLVHRGFQLGHVALVDQARVPGDGLLEFGVVVVEVGAPGVLVGVGPAGGAGEVAPLGLAQAAACAVEAQAVDGDVVLVEAGFVAAFAAFVHGQVGDGLLVAAAVLGVPAEVLDLVLADACVGGHCLVVEDRDRVPVFRQPVALAVFADPEVGQAFVVDREVNRVLLEGVIEGQQLLGFDQFRVFGEVVGEDVRGVSGDEAVGEGGPVVVPSALGDLDGDVRVGLVEVVGALLVGRALARGPRASSSELALGFLG